LVLFSRPAVGSGNYCGAGVRRWRIG
jgi:hypothetical protein